MVHVKNSIKSDYDNLFIYFASDKGGDRVAWTKQWIASPDIWTFRANFDSRVRKNTTNMHNLYFIDCTFKTDFEKGSFCRCGLALYLLTCQQKTRWQVKIKKLSESKY